MKQTTSKQFVKLATGADADVFAQEHGWDSYEHHVQESGKPSGYYIVSLDAYELQDEQIQTGTTVEVQVCSNIARIYFTESVQALVVNGEYYMDAQEYEEKFL